LREREGSCGFSSSFLIGGGGSREFVLWIGEKRV